MDCDGSGTLTTDELRKALTAAGVPQARLIKLLRLADADGSGCIDMTEWTNAIKSGSSTVEMRKMAQMLAEKKMKDGVFSGLYSRGQR